MKCNLRGYRGLTLAIVAGSCLGVAGCQPTVKSPITGKDVTAPQLVQEADAESKRLEREAQAKADLAAKRIKDAEREARQRFREIEGDVEATVADAKRVRETIADDLGAKVDESTADFERALSDLRTNAADLEDATNVALADIEAKRAKMLGVLSFVSNIPVVGQGLNAAGIGDLAPLATLLIGGGVASWSARRSKKREDEAWDEAERKARTAAEDTRRAEERAWDLSRLESVTAPKDNTLAELAKMIADLKAKG